jgi:ATP-dependent Clp protease adapter protein ClpS
MTPSRYYMVSPSASIRRIPPSSLTMSTVVVDNAPAKISTTTKTTAPSRTQQQKRSHSDSNFDNYNLWQVKVYNDNINTHEWVARCLVVVAAQSEWQAYQITKMAHQQGEACLGIWEKELAERYVQGLSQEGLIVDMFPLEDFQ